MPFSQKNSYLQSKLVNDRKIIFTKNKICSCTSDIIRGTTDSIEEITDGDKIEYAFGREQDQRSQSHATLFTGVSSKMIVTPNEKFPCVLSLSRR